MKKIFLVVLLMTWVAHPALASPIGLGIRAGVNMANQTGWSSDFNPDVLFGFSGGAFAEFPLNDFLSIQPEANFSMKGVRLSQGSYPEVNMSGQIIGYTTASSASFNFNYLEFPVLLKVHTALSPHLIGSLSAGPSIEFPMTTYDDVSVSGVNNINALNNVTSDWGALMGAGLEMDGFLIDLRYDLGFTSTNQNFSSGSRNCVFSLSLGYRIQ